MKIYKRILTLAMSLAIIFSISITSATAEEYSPNISTYNDWVQLLKTTNSFDISSSGVATMVATTMGERNSTKVTLDMYLERLQNGKWTTVSGMSWSTSSTSDYYVSLDKTRSVVSGYNYRLRTEHSAKGPNGMETDTIYSGSVYY